MDKREAVRVSVRMPALCRSQEVVLAGCVENISRTGLFLRVTKPMGEGSAVEIELMLPGEPPLYLPAKVVRVEQGPARVGMGLRILADEPEYRRLANFIMRQHETLAERAKFPSRIDGLVA